jgi:hypothetical protein
MMAGGSSGKKLWVDFIWVGKLEGSLLVFFLSGLAGKRARGARHFKSVSRPGPERWSRPS